MSMTSAHGANPAIVKSLNDKREYRLITLNNGLRALLVSDLTGTADEDLSIIQDCTVGSESDETDSECSEESDHSEDEKFGKDLESTREGEKKSAAALCIGVGSFSDPDDIPGFAHFLEHMVFMGSEKYPTENDFDDYISKYGGSTNAMTDCERTFFHFDVERKHFRKSLDRFANFFVSPCLQNDSVDREIKAVDSEFQMAIQQDGNRLYQILSSCAQPGHPMGKFMWGNIDTLKHVPEKNNNNVYEKLRGFCNRMYSAHYMTLAIQSKDTLDTLETMVRESFSGIPNNQMKQPDFSIYKNPFDTDSFRKWYKAVPVENINKLEIMWALPPLLDCYRVKPLDYIAALMAHEGKGSILSYLKKKNWALRLTGGNDGGGYEMNSTWSAFSLTVTLTDQGLEQVENVCCVIFEYLSMLKSEGVQKWVFEELKQIEQSKFRWKEQDEPVDYVEKLCEYMQLYPPEDFLTGCYLFFDYDEQLIQRCISHLQPDNCNVMVLSTTFKQTETCDQKEKWFGTKYSVSEIPQHLLNKWKNPDSNPCLHIPVRNCFIATDFSVGECSGDDGSLYPKVIMQNDMFKLHYKRDGKFKVPKGYVNVHLMSPVAYRSLESMTLLDLYINILQQNLTEDIYPAQMAGYEYTLDGLQTGMQVQIEGFNHKLPLVAEMVFKHITDFHCSIDMFEAMRTEMKKVYYNEMIKPYELARALRFSVIMKTCWPVQERYNIIARITKKNLEQFVQEFVSNIFIEALVIGNFSAYEAEDICYQITSKFTGPPVPANMQFKELLLELPVQQTYCQVNNINPEDNNSCVTNYYQSTAGNIRSCCLNELLQMRIREPFFNILRTQQQLGYTVFCENLITHGILGMACTVEYQEDKFSAAHVNQMIGEFLLEAKEIVKQMSQEEFEDMVSSLITIKSSEDVSLCDEVTRHWREVQEQTYIFDRHLKEIEILKTISHDDLNKWFATYLGNVQKKLSLQVVGRSTPACDKNVEAVPQKRSKLTHEPVVQYKIDPLQALAVPITDKQLFKDNLNCFPLTKIVS
ncbi:hypothetical protein ACJMK2_042264 [Sinanodonta woodiana]|uniref:Nardilysin n=1 Tax=Sinanodonta woodiana TaxID=1069815 RepID=A0ABD3W7G8_SINWO